MDWIKKNPAKLVLAILALLLLASSAFIILNTTSFGETFSAIQTTPPRKDTIPPVDTTIIQEGQANLEKPATWQVDPKKHGPLFVAHRYVVVDGRPRRIDTDGPALHGDVPNEWLLKYGLNVLSGTVLREDPDGDGFSTGDEYLGADRSAANGDADATDPTDKASHPPYHTQLFVRRYIKVPFRIRFEAYVGDAAKPADLDFQINTLDLRQSSQFLKLGEPILGTKFKLEKFEPKTVVVPSTGAETDVSELTLVHVDTGEPVVLVYRQDTDSPESFAEFEYRWVDPPQVFSVKKNQEFALRPNVNERYKLIDIKETEALIQLPSGDKYTVPRVP